MNASNEKKNGEFYTRFHPFTRRIYRSALIVTGCPRSAEKLQANIYLKAFIAYLQAGHVADFKVWLAEIVREAFSEYPRPRRVSSIGANVRGEAAAWISEKFSDGKPPASIKTRDREAIGDNQEPLTQR